MNMHARNSYKFSGAEEGPNLIHATANSFLSENALLPYQIVRDREGWREGWREREREIEREVAILLPIRTASGHCFTH